jgi:multicomponent Na+:H+ antiporter subunit A
MGSLPGLYKDLKLQSAVMWLPPLFLGALGLCFGLFPGLIDKSLIQPVVLSMQSEGVDISLKLWHGFNIILLLSVVTLVIGISLYLITKPSENKTKFISRFNAISPQHLVILLLINGKNSRFSIQMFFRMVTCVSMFYLLFHFLSSCFRINWFQGVRLVYR